MAPKRNGETECKNTRTKIKITKNKQIKNREYES